MTTIYAVTQGCYSDYRVVALFSTREMAQLFMDRHKAGGIWNEWNDIEEYPLDDAVAELSAGMSRWWVRMKRNGAVMVAKMTADCMDDKPDAEFRKETEWCPEQWFNWYGWAHDEQHAIKIASEHRIALIVGPAASAAEGQS